MNYTNIYKKITGLYSMVPYTFFKGYAFPPLNVLFELTYRCNLRCRMCQFLPLVQEYNKFIQQDPGLELSFEDIKQAIEQLPRKTLLTFTGGEPFLRKDILDILRYGTARNICHLITNGTLLNDTAVSELIAMGAKNILGPGLIMIELSLEGTRQVHDRITSVPGSYQKTIDNIKALAALKRQRKQKYPLINIALVITKENVRIIPEIVDLAEELNADIISFLTYTKFPHFERLRGKIVLKDNPSEDNYKEIDKDLLSTQVDRIVFRQKNSKCEIRFSPHGLSTDQIIRYYTDSADINDYICYAPWAKIIISSCGDILPCPNYVIGNIKKQKFSAIWNGEKAQNFRNRIKKHGITSECLGCCMLESK